MKLYILLLVVPIVSLLGKKYEDTLDKEDSAVLEDILPMENKLFSKFLSSLREIAGKDETVQTALSILLKPKLKKLKAALFALPDYQEFHNLMVKYNTIYSLIYKQNPVRVLQHLAKEHSNVKPTCKYFLENKMFSRTLLEWIMFRADIYQRLPAKMHVPGIEHVRKLLRRIYESDQFQDIIQYFIGDEKSDFINPDLIIEDLLISDYALHRLIADELDERK
ncbi:hypothetical protein Trydic_g23553 [Trypoxylus dichotomus]